MVASTPGPKPPNQPARMMAGEKSRYEGARLQPRNHVGSDPHDDGNDGDGNRVARPPGTERQRDKPHGPGAIATIFRHVMRSTCGLAPESVRRMRTSASHDDHHRPLPRRD